VILLLKYRTIKEVLKVKPTLEGAGVKLNRAFGFHETSLFDPFLLLDHFQSDNPDDYIAGFPWHPHRGIETITYMLYGYVKHEDSLGNKGIIQSGDIQWMTAGSGIIHQEMPNQENGLMGGFQLWANLPKSHKMMHPRYREITAKQIPDIAINDKVSIKIICGEINGTKGPVRDIVIEPEYYDVTIKSEGKFTHHFKKGHTVFAYIFEGAGIFHPDGIMINKGNIVVFNDGEDILIQAKGEELRFLLVSGKPLNEPIAWRGPIVMNTNLELRTAFDEFQRGTFIKHK